jgi:hypothetical protein
LSESVSSERADLAFPFEHASSERSDLAFPFEHASSERSDLAFPPERAAGGVRFWDADPGSGHGARADLSFPAVF